MRHFGKHSVSVSFSIARFIYKRSFLLVLHSNIRSFRSLQRGVHMWHSPHPARPHLARSERVDLHAVPNPSRRQAIADLLLFRQEVSEKTLVHFQKMQGDKDAQLYSMSMKERFQHFSRHHGAGEAPKGAQQGRPRSALGTLIVTSQSWCLQEVRLW
jgi:hypothetical protein